MASQQKEVAPVAGSNYEQLFGTAVGSDVVVPVGGEGGFDQYFGGSVTQPVEARPPAAAPPQPAAQKAVWGTGGSFVQTPRENDETHRESDAVESAQTAAPAGITVRVRHGVGTFITTQLRRALVIFGAQPACHQAAMLLVEEVASTRTFASVTVAGPKAMEYCGIGSDLVQEIVIDLDKVDASKLAGHDVAFCIMGHFAEDVSVLDDILDEASIEKENHLQPTNIIRILAEGGCQHLHMTSLAGADPSASSCLLRARAKAEDALVAADFARAAIYRPGYIKGKSGSSVSDFLGSLVLPAFEFFGPLDASIRIETFARALATTALSRTAEDLTVLENRDILRAAGSSGDGVVPEIMSAAPVIDDMIAEADRDAAFQAALHPDDDDVVLGMFDFGKDDEEDGGGKPAKKSRTAGPQDDEDVFRDMFGADDSSSKRAVGPQRSALDSIRQSSRTVPVIGRLVPPQTRDFGIQTG